MISVNFLGTTGKDAEVRYTKDGKAIWNVSAAGNFGYGDKRGTLWFKLEAWDKQAENFAKWDVKKGARFYISGELTEETWTNKDGVEQKTLKIRVNALENASPKGQDAGKAPARSPANIRHQEQKADGYAPHVPSDPDDDVPF